MFYADMLSRATLQDEETEKLFNNELNVCGIQATPQRLASLRDATAEDRLLQSVIGMLNDKHPIITQECKPFMGFKDELSYKDGLLFKKKTASHSRAFESRHVGKIAPVSSRCNEMQGYCTTTNLLLGRGIRTRIPMKDNHTNPQNLNLKDVKEKLELRQEKQEQQFDKKAGKDKPVLPIGAHVRYRASQGAWRHGVIIKMPAPTKPSSYLIKGDTGCTYSRNRKHIFKSGETWQLYEEDDPWPEQDAEPQTVPMQPVAPQRVTTRYGCVVHPPDRLNL
ncbi:hypothetical protein CAPTEDRAFT_191020 [Capitella teleta]|uniref:Uncharacterized protein n=1 Tax=Capitella teleta TaxID=283909 RepID=R7TDX2_CAPTE|nr:hypothetical protein CAPTEDRAFT_191020 [Capitella teleta]|eukprot:ELT89236.1 hypothetical protein CAPTEDRAFT_191020 [Capitella teleta]